MRSFILLTLCLLALPTPAQPQHFDLTVGDATFRAVVVPADTRLAYTTQLLPDPTDAPPAAGQYRRVMESLTTLLSQVSSTPADIVRLNVYASTPAAAAEIRPLLNSLSAAVTITVTPLPEEATIAMDAVAVAHAETSPNPRRIRLLPPDGATFISGMAAKAPTLAESTHGTLEQLAAVLDHFGLTKSDVVHVKSFFKPMSASKTAEYEIAGFFGPAGMPPASWVEWTLPGPIEIELVAKAAKKNADPADTASYHNPPPSKPSPLFARAVLTHGGRLIYTSSIYAGHPLDPEPECNEVLTSLRDLLAKSGTDFNHLVKATYYPSSDGASTALNTVRPKFYNPQRPPAASKSNVAAGPFENRHVTLDMIAVTPPEKK